jgi:hypothetical protein
MVRAWRNAVRAGSSAPSAKADLAEQQERVTVPAILGIALHQALEGDARHAVEPVLECALATSQSRPGSSRAAVARGAPSRSAETTSSNARGPLGDRVMLFHRITAPRARHSIASETDPYPIGELRGRFLGTLISYLRVCASTFS